MKLPSAIIVLALLAPTTAQAADMSVPATPAPPIVTKAPPLPPPPLAPVAAPDWSGFYLGINGGVLFNDGSGTPLFGGTAGYNVQFGLLVLGVEGDIDAAWPQGGGTDGLGTIRGRIGLPLQWFMPYFTAGYAFSDFSTSGLAIGGGAEFRLTPALSLKAEYLHVDLGEEDNMVRLGLNWRFNFGMPLMARY